MKKTGFYIIKDKFFEDMPDPYLKGNKAGNRPHYYCFEDTSTGIYWMIPLSSKVDKYEKEYQHSLNKYKICDNISFGYVLGQKKAFLPQNLFPVTENYIENIYLNPDTHQPVLLDKKLMVELNAKARKKIRYNKMGKAFGLSNINKIYHELLREQKESA